MDIYKQLADHLRGLQYTVSDTLDGNNLVGKESTGEALRRALTSGLFMHAAMREPDGNCLWHLPTSLVHGIRCVKQIKINLEDTDTIRVLITSL